MSFSRTLLVAVAALSFTMVAFAKESANPPAAQPAATVDASQSFSKVNLNKATAIELEKVKGFTISKAKAIIAYRKKHGDFKTLDELKEVKGFKKMDEKTLKDIQAQLTLS